MTINEAMSLLAQVKGRINRLNDLRSQVSVDTRWLGDTTKIVEAKYDVKKLDARIVHMENWIWKIDSRIKAVNARTDIGVFGDDNKDVPVDELLRALE